MGWKAAAPATSAGLQHAVTPWSSCDYNQQDRPAQTLAYSATPTLTADVYMQTLCPSYTMLTYTHAPLLTNFGVSFARQGFYSKVLRERMYWENHLREKLIFPHHISHSFS